MKKDAYYFPHFSNARNDAKIVKLRRVLGIEGYGLYFMILESLREQTEFKMAISGIEDLAYEWHVSKEKIASVVKDFDLFSYDSEYYWSDKLVLYLKPYIEKSERARLAARKRWDDIKAVSNANADANALPEHNNGNADKNASKGEESKGKESKGKEYIESEFEKFWNFYGKKKDRKKCLAKWMKLKEADKDKIRSTIPDYIKSTPDTQFRKDPLTYLNGECWNDEIITTNNKDNGQGRVNNEDQRDKAPKTPNYFGTFK